MFYTAEVDDVNLWTKYFHASKDKGRGLIVPLIVCAWWTVHITFLVDLLHHDNCTPHMYWIAIFIPTAWKRMVIVVVNRLHQCRLFICMEPEEEKIFHTTTINLAGCQRIIMKNKSNTSNLVPCYPITSCCLNYFLDLSRHFRMHHTWHICSEHCWRYILR